MSIEYIYLENLGSWMVMGSGNVAGVRFDMKSHFKRSKLEATSELFDLIRQALAYTKSVPILSPYVIQ